MQRLIVDDPERVGRWTCERTGGFYTAEGCYAIGVEEDGILIAGCMYDHYYKKSIAMHIAATPGKRWMTRERLEAAFGYPFDHLKVDKIIGLVQEDNLVARRFDEHLGFVLETRVKDACAGGDLLIYSMTRSQCRFLRRTE